MEEISMDPKEYAKELGPAADAPIGPFVGVASIALNLAMKYHDISTVQDGALYQQYKLEGRNMQALHIDIVFETAMQIEKHLLAANRRVVDALIATMVEVADEADATSSSPDDDPMNFSNEPERDQASLKQDVTS